MKACAAVMAPVCVAAGMLAATTSPIAYQDAANLVTLDLERESRWAVFLKDAAPRGVDAYALLNNAFSRDIVPQAGADGAGKGADDWPTALSEKAAAASLAALDAVVVNRGAKAGAHRTNVVRERKRKARVAFTAGLLENAPSLLAATDMDIGWARSFAHYDDEAQPQRTQTVSVEEIVDPAGAIEKARGDDVPESAMALAPTGRDAEPESEGGLFGGAFAHAAMTVPMPKGRIAPSEEAIDEMRAEWAEKAIKAGGNRDKALKCLAEAIYFEARSEPEQGQLAVAQVVFNRVHSRFYPDTVCGVVYQNQEWRNRCQFSFACDGKPETITEKRPWRVAKVLSEEISQGRHWVKAVGESTHYHATYVNPYWISDMKKMQRIGQHIFYQVRAWMDDDEEDEQEDS